MEISALLENKDLLRGIFYSAVDGIMVINGSGIILLANPASAKLFGYEIEEMIGHNINFLMPSPHHEAHDDYLQRYEQTGIRRIIGIGREVQGKRKDGVLIPLDLSVSELNINGERIYTGILHDISVQKVAQDSIKKINEQLEIRLDERAEMLADVVNKLLESNNNLKTEVEERQIAESALRESGEVVKQALEKERELGELKSRFVSTASHEFRTPLSTILSSAALIERYSKEEQQAQRIKHIQRIKSSVNNLIGVLNDFLSLSKLEEGKTEDKTSEFDLVELASEIVEEMQVFAKDGQQIQHSHQGTTTLVVLNKQFLKNILINLISNAVKYSNEHQQIDFQTIITTEKIEIKVTDKGMGIPKEEQVHLFERFFRAKNATNIQGTGLGLNIVKKYVDLMNGVISVESNLGEGTTIALSFLVAKQA